jgi:hypothetical protein
MEAPVEAELRFSDLECLLLLLRFLSRFLRLVDDLVLESCESEQSSSCREERFRRRLFFLKDLSSPSVSTCTLRLLRSPPSKPSSTHASCFVNAFMGSIRALSFPLFRATESHI